MTFKFSKVLLGLSAATLAVGGVAYAQSQDPSPRHGGRMMDANGDGMVTRAEAQSAADAMFARFDTNKDGKLDKADREARMAEMKAKKFAMIDTNKDGSISRDEFMAHHGPDRRGKPGMQGEGRKGQHMGRHGGMYRGMKMLGMADANKDGAVTKAEFETAAMARFDKVDANKDGKLTKEERQAMRASKRSDGPPAPSGV